MVNKEGGIPTKLIKKLIIALTAITTAFVLGTTALADGWYTAHGGSNIGVQGKYVDISINPYFQGNIDLAWRVDFYVSGRDDGKIDKSQDTIYMGADKNLGSDYLHYVSSLIYTNMDISGTATYLQVNKTDSIRKNGLPVTEFTYKTDERGNIVGTECVYGLPSAIKLESYSASAVDPKGNEVFIVQGTTNGLPSSIGGCSKETLHNTAESADFMINCANDLLKRMGGNGMNFFSKIKTCVSSKIWEEAISGITKDSSDDEKVEAMQCLMPDAIYQNKKPLVEWAITLTPMMIFRASDQRVDSFWAFYDQNGEMKVVMPSNLGKPAALIMDIYYTTSYNQATTGSNVNTAIWFQSQFRKAVDKANGTIEASTIDEFCSLGVMRRWFTSKEGMSALRNLARCAYLDEPGPICGIYDWITPTDYSDETMGKYGGIYLAILEIEDTKSIPVYYYITPDPNDPTQTNPKSVPVDKPFTPNPPAGTTVKKVVIPDKPLPNTSSENPPQDFPPDQPAVPKNPDGTYPIEPDNPPYILVECEQTAIPVYYHVFTFTNTTGKKYTDVFDFLKDNPSIGESSKNVVETITCKETVLSLADNKTAQYTPNAEYADGGVIVEALSTSTTAGNDRWSPMITNMSSQLSCNTSINYDHVPKGMLLINPAKEPLGNQSVEYYGKIDPKSATRSIHVKVYALADSKPVEGPERDTDRIKTYDVTQYIVIDDSSTSHIRITDKTNKELSAEEGSFSVPDVVMFELDCEGKSEESGAVILRRLRRERRALGLFLRYVIMNSWRKCI